MRSMGIGRTELQNVQWTGFTNPRRNTSMRKQIVAAGVVALFALGLAGGIAWAGNAAKVDIPFSFVVKQIVKDNSMPAGIYEISSDPADSTHLTIRSNDGTHSTKVSVIERLAATGATQPKIVFDKIGDANYLSEIHMPGQDGYLVFVATGHEQHTHVTVTGRE
jgi:hypothetical protein